VIDNIPSRRRARSWTAPAALLATSAVLTLAACGGPAASSASSTSTGSSTGSTSGVVNITWQTMWSGETLTLLNQMVTEFNKTHPDIHVTESNIPSATGDAKLLSEIAAGDPPDVFTEWNPVLGEYAADGTIQSMSPYLTGTYAGLEKWEYPIALQGGEYKGSLYALPMSMNSWALYYNKSMLKAAGISSPPTTLAQLYADQAKEWKTPGGKLEQIGFDPDAGDNAGFEYYGSFFGAVNCFDSAGKYSFETCPAATTEANWLAQYDNYPLSDVEAMEAAYGAVAGGEDDPFVAGKEGFDMDGPWEGAENIPVTNPSMNANFGVEADVSDVGQVLSVGDGIARIYGLDGKLMEFFAHDGPLTAATFVGDNKRVATASADKSARLWTSALVWQSAQAGPVREAAFSAPKPGEQKAVFQALAQPDGGAVVLGVLAVRVDTQPADKQQMATEVRDLGQQYGDDETRAYVEQARKDAKVQKNIGLFDQQ